MPSVAFIKGALGAARFLSNIKALINHISQLIYTKQGKSVLHRNPDTLTLGYGPCPEKT